MDNSKEGNCSSPPPINESSEGNEQDAILQFISEMLMEEEELGNNPYMLHNGLALKATEKSLYDALHNINLDPESLIGSSQCITDAADGPQASLMYPYWVSNTFRSDSGQGGDISPSSFNNYQLLGHHDSGSGNKTTGDHLKTASSGVKKNRSREDADFSAEHHRRSHKQSANNKSDDEPEPLEMYDDVLLCPDSDISKQTCDETADQGNAKQSKGGPKRGGGGRGKKNNIIDLQSLLMQCAQAVANFDNKTLSELLLEIRRHSSPRGDGIERLAHYFANALEARLACTGTDLYVALTCKRVTMADILKAYRMFFIACPFRKMTKILTNRTIGTLDSRATSLHIIDFGILYGFQWPDLIYALSQRPGGPPKLRITGIDFPQPGLRPAERVADTGRRLAKWADRFGVPFEYNAIAQKWDTITLEDVKIEKNELVVVNCMYRLHNVPDEMVSEKSPRDDVLNLIKKINPGMFIHGIANGTYDTPFFIPRFREAFFHFSAMFDMFDTTMPKDAEYRMLFEEHIFGKEALNIIACEGTERVERPKTYKHWQARTVRAGFRQVPIDQEIVKSLSTMKTGYHKSFSVDEDGKWVLLGWKGRVIKGFSCWRPVHN